MPQELFLVVKQCSDPWYGYNPNGQVFTRKEDAVAYVTKLNGGPSDDNSQYEDYYGIETVTLDPEVTK